jgi:hypothetical protein
MFSVSDFASVVVGVAHNPNPFPSVLGIDGDSRNSKRPAGVADAFQVSQHTVEFHRDDARHILSKHPSGLGL